MVWVETNKSSLADLAVKHQQTLKQEYELLELAINVVEEFKKTMKTTKAACTEFCKRFLSTYNRC